MVVKKIFEGNFDEEVHNDFLKFGRGEYNNRYLLEGKKQAGKWAIKTGPEFVNLLVKKCLKEISGKIPIKGIIVSTIDLKNEINFDIEKYGNFQGIRKLNIDTQVSSEEILSLMEKYPRVFFALSFNGNNFSLKIKAKAPKSGKPGKESEEGPRADFCTLKTEDKELVDELFFDIQNFKEVSINHTIKITYIVYPKNMDDLKPEEIREQSKRKGVIKRIVNADGKEKISEAEFAV